MKRALVPLLLLPFAACLAQDRLAGMMDIGKTVAKRQEIQRGMKLASAQVRWTGDATLAVQRGDGWHEIDCKSGAEKKLDKEPAVGGPVARTLGPNDRRRRPERGRQFAEEFSPDGTKRAFYRDGNLWWAAADGAAAETAITKEGDAAKRIKYGSASWVYGEELGQRDAMGWSPDGKKVWFYRFDDGQAKDYYVTLSETAVQNVLDTEAYPKAGAPNPVCDVYIYDFATGRRVQVKVRAGAFDEGVGHYVYGLSWSPDGKELLFHRTNRWQNTMELCAADPETGAVRVIVREEWPASWTENSPTAIMLDNDANIAQAPQLRGKMVWRSARNGFDNFYLVDLKSGATVALTKNQQEAGAILRVDVAGGWLYYMAAGPQNPYMTQLHRVRLDGSRDEMVTDPALNHSANLSPGGSYFVDTSQALDVAPRIVLRSMDGKAVKVLSESDLSGASGFRPSQRVLFTAADGRTQCYGSLQFPADFDPAKKYPVIVDIYGGPESGGYSETFRSYDRKTDYGFIVAGFAGRGTSGRGKAFMDAVYMKLGVVEIDDEAEGVRAIAKLPYVDGTRVGITGTSYGGYSSCMCLLRFPDVFAAAASCSSVTDWQNYDTIYTERYMRTPQANPDGYKAGAHMTYAANLKGWLMLYYGTADNNVHPSNTYQLVQALQRAGKSFELQVGPDAGHSGMNFQRMMEFFIERLCITGPRK